MKNKIIIPFFLVFLVIQGVSAGNYSAYEGTTDSLELGGTHIGYAACNTYSTNTGVHIEDGIGVTDDLLVMDYYCSTTCSAYATISVPFAGNTTWVLDSSHNIDGLRGVLLNVDHTYSYLDCGVVWAHNWSNISCYSNIGAYILYESALGGIDFTINLSHSTVTYTKIDDMVYSAGDTVYMPILSRFANCTGAKSTRDTSVLVYSNTLLNLQTNSALDYTNYDLSCTDTGTTYQLIYDFLTPSYANDQTYSKAIVIEPLVPLNFTSYYANATNINVGELIRFSVIANNPSYVDAVAWYVNGGLFEYGSNYSITGTFYEPGVYFIEAQLEDNGCGQYPTVNWTVNVGKAITVYGKVVDENNNPIADAIVTMYDREPAYTNTSGDYMFKNITGYCNTGSPYFSGSEYFLYASKDGYTTGLQNFTPICGSSYETLIQRNFRLSTTTTTGSARISALDYDTGTYLSNYSLELYRAGMHVLTINNGVVTYNVSLTYYNATNTGNPSTITQLPISYSYEALIAKPGYASIDGSDRYTWTQTDTYQTDVYLYLVGEVEFNASANWSSLSPVDGTNIDASGGIFQQISGTVTTDQNTYIICVYYQESGGTWYNYCSDNRISGVYTHGEVIYIQPNKVYNYYFTAEYNSQTKFNSPITSFTTNGTAPTTTTSTSIHYATTTTIYQIPTNQTYYNGSHTQKEYNCTNPWALIKDNGDWYHGSICMYVKPLGVDWTYGLTFILIIMYVYIRTRSTIAISIISLLITGAFYEYLPQPTMVLLAVGLAFGIGFAIYGLFFETYKQEKDKYLKR